MNDKIQIFEDKRIRTAWNEEKEEWYFSVVDVVSILTDSVDGRKYWNKLKQRLKDEGNETVTNCHQLKMKAADSLPIYNINKMKGTVMRKIYAPILVIIACVIMGVIDSVVQPGYIAKSAIKILLFIFIPLVYGFCNKEYSIKSVLKPKKRGFLTALALGVVVYGVVLGAYFLFRNIFDFSLLVGSLGETTGVNKSNFLWVAIYISFINSFLEEIFFRGFAFLKMKQFYSRKFSYIFSSFAFAFYHIAMMLGWFDLPVILISILGLFVGGVIFNRFDEKYENIYLSWLVHMFGNFATNSIGFILFAAQ